MDHTEQLEASLFQTVQTQKKTIEDLRKTLAYVRGQLDEATGRVKHLMNSNEALRKEIEGRKRSQQNQKTRIENLELRLYEANAQIKTKDSRIQSLEDSQAFLAGSVAGKDKLIEEQKAYIIEKAEQLAEKDGIVSSYVAMACDTDAEMNELKEQLAQAQRAVEIVEALSKLPKGYRLIRGMANTNWWIDDDKQANMTKIHCSVADTLIALGLLESAPTETPKE